MVGLYPKKTHCPLTAVVSSAPDVGQRRGALTSFLIGQTCDLVGGFWVSGLHSKPIPLLELYCSKQNDSALPLADKRLQAGDAYFSKATLY